MRKRTDRKRSVPEGCPRRVYGVDFSGAADAGRKIWIAAGAADSGGPRVDECFRAEDLPGSGRDIHRCLAALREFVGQDEGSAFGFDFPFGLPAALIGEQGWMAFALSFGRRYPTPQPFRETCQRAANGRDLKRTTDRERRTPFSPYNLRVYRQTYFGIRDLLGPLAATPSTASWPPWQPSGRCAIRASCPGSERGHTFAKAWCFRRAASGRTQRRSRTKPAWGEVLVESQGFMQPQLLHHRETRTVRKAEVLAMNQLKTAHARSRVSNVKGSTRTSWLARTSSPNSTAARWPARRRIGAELSSRTSSEVTMGRPALTARPLRATASAWPESRAFLMARKALDPASAPTDASLKPPCPPTDPSPLPGTSGD